MESNPQITASEIDEPADELSVDDFLRELEEKEKDLHITAETSIVEIAESFDDGELPDFLAPEPSSPGPVEPAKAHGNGTGAKLRDELASLKSKIADLENERTELIQTAQRRSRDFDNYKTRTERERGETFQNQLSNLAVQMLPALDNLNRALDFALEMPDESRAGIQPFIDGVVLVNQQVNDVLAGMGILPIKSVGEGFDPNFHEAVATEETDSFAEGTVAAEVLRGYRIGDRVIRASLVKVAKALPTPPTVTAPDEVGFDEGDTCGD